MAKDIVDVALGEVGYRETGNNLTKYGQWMCMNGYAWCHMFVSWCAAQAGEAAAVPYTASCSYGLSWFDGRGQYKLKGQYTPKRCDIIYFGGNHVGIVVSCDGGTVYTVEGNSSDQVARRSYSLSDSKITGYGVPAYANSNVPSGSSPAAPINLKKIETNRLPAAKVRVIVNNGKKKFAVPVKDGMKITWERKEMPGKLTFEAMVEKGFKIVEGNAVLVSVDGVKLFYGFVFTRQKTKSGLMSYTVYDQLRYLKNKDTILYKKKRADELVRLIAGRFGMNCGKLENTGYAMSAIEDDTSLFDMVQNALDNTLLTKDQMYVLYDKAGSLRLTNVSRMKVNNCLIDSETGEDYTYKTTIDDNVYNQVKLIYENKETGSYDIYIAKSTKSINKWGVLQYLEKIDDPDIGKLKSEACLKLYNQKIRRLTITGVVGNKKVRGGSLVPVILRLGDIKIANYMLVEKVTHTFDNRQHTMDLVLSGGGFSAE